MDLAARRVLVVGGSRGIGEAIATAAAEAGARVVAAARSQPELPGVVGVVGDVADPDSCRSLVTTALDELGRLDLLVYCPALLPLAALVDTDAATWSAVLNTNVRGAALVTRAALPALTATRGRAAYLSSDIVTEPRAGLGAYGVSKAALDMLVDCWRLEVPEVSFTRFTVGPTFTTIARDWNTALATRLAAQWVAAGWSPAGVMTPEQVADRVLAVLSDPAPAAVVDVLP